MKFRSTRGSEHDAIGFGDALQRGLAPDGGLYVPAEWPKLAPADFGSELSLPAVGAQLIAPFAAGDAALAAPLRAIVAEAFSFPAPLVPHWRRRSLRRARTLPRPDGGVQGFRRALPRGMLPAPATPRGQAGEHPGRDFGRHRRRGRGGVPPPPRACRSRCCSRKGLVSPTQQQQLTCWGDNVRSLAVRGSFDDCQALVKQAFVDPSMRSQFELSSANSINLGRLLPQAVYYAASSLAAWRRHGEPLSFIVPSGNLGNVVACCWARKVGLPIGDILLAHNANTHGAGLSSARVSGTRDRASPRLRRRWTSAILPTWSGCRPCIQRWRRCAAPSVPAASTMRPSRARIKADFTRFGQVWCPHTATAAEAWARLPEASRRARRWCIVSTAHPAKFAEIVEPLIGRAVTVPESLRELFDRPSGFVEIDANLPALRAALGA